uniref:Transcription activation suppressor n=1 Tax=Scleropages formosus TaxID=113540 RepID=A0A8C9WFV6_SCLFO
WQQSINRELCTKLDATLPCQCRLCCSSSNCVRALSIYKTAISVKTVLCRSYPTFQSLFSSAALFQHVTAGSREFEDLVKTLTSCYRDCTSTGTFTYTKARLVHSELLEKDFVEKKRELKQDGRTDKELQESFCFFLPDSSKLHSICEKGLSVGHSRITTLGNPTMGVYLSKYSDLLQMNPFDPGTTGDIIIFKVMKGRVKSIYENISKNVLDPTPKFDCHVSKNAAKVTSLRSYRAFELTQQYFYEYSFDEIKSRPRHVCPYAVLSFLYKGKEATPPPKPLAPSNSNISEGAKSRSNYTVWSGQLLNGGKAVFQVSLQSSTLPFLPIKLPEKLEISTAMSLEQVKRKIPAVLFSWSTYFGVREVLKSGMYCSLFAVIDRSRHGNGLTVLLHKLERERMVFVNKLMDRGFLFLLSSAQMITPSGMSRFYCQTQRSNACASISSYGTVCISRTAAWDYLSGRECGNVRLYYMNEYKQNLDERDQVRAAPRKPHSKERTCLRSYICCPGSYVLTIRQARDMMESHRGPPEYSPVSDWEGSDSQPAAARSNGAHGPQLAHADNDPEKMKELLRLIQMWKRNFEGEVRQTGEGREGIEEGIWDTRGLKRKLETESTETAVKYLRPKSSCQVCRDQSQGRVFVQEQTAGSMSSLEVFSPCSSNEQHRGTEFSGEEPIPWVLIPITGIMRAIFGFMTWKELRGGAGCYVDTPKFSAFPNGVQLKFGTWTGKKQNPADDNYIEAHGGEEKEELTEGSKLTHSLSHTAVFNQLDSILDEEFSEFSLEIHGLLKEEHICYTPELQVPIQHQPLWTQRSPFSVYVSGHVSPEPIHGYVSMLHERMSYFMGSEIAPRGTSFTSSTIAPAQSPGPNPISAVSSGPSPSLTLASSLAPDPVLTPVTNDGMAVADGGTVQKEPEPIVVRAAADDKSLTPVTGSAPAAVDSGSGTPSISSLISQLKPEVFSSLVEIIKDVQKNAVKFYIHSGEEESDVCVEIKEYLMKLGNVECNPQSFLQEQNKNNLDKLLIIIPNVDIAAHVHKIPALVSLKKLLSVSFAGVDSLDDVKNHTYNELFISGGFIVSDEFVLNPEFITYEKLQAFLKFLEDQSTPENPWQWKVHCKTQKKLKELGRLNSDALSLLNLLATYQKRHLVEFLPYHECDAPSRHAPDLDCLIRLQAHHTQHRHIIFLTERRFEMFPHYSNNGIVIASIDDIMSSFHSLIGFHDSKEEVPSTDVQSVPDPPTGLPPLYCKSVPT